VEDCDDRNYVNNNNDEIKDDPSLVGLADESVIITLWNQVYCIQNIGSRKDREHPSENFAFLFERFTEVFVHGVV
jgi:hypothetical protein